MQLFVITCAILALCDAYAVDKPKCGLSDGECLSKLFRGIIDDIAEKGDPELGIQVADPYSVKNFDLSLLGMVKLTIVDGKATGFKSCHSTSFTMDVDSMRARVEVTCDVFDVEGHHKISTLPGLDAVVGGLKIHGDGNAKLHSEKATMVLDFAFEIVKLDDGEYHIQLNKANSVYTSGGSEKATFDIANVYVGSQDIGTVTTAILNENWQIVHRLFGQSMLDNIMSIFYLDAERFFKGIPAKDLISDDLSKYVKN